MKEQEVLEKLLLGWRLRTKADVYLAWLETTAPYPQSQSVPVRQYVLDNLLKDGFIERYRVETVYPHTAYYRLTANGRFKLAGIYDAPPLFDSIKRRVELWLDSLRRSLA